MRMRTVFVPYLLFQSSEPDAEVDHVLAAGHTEHTVVLCVELEHPGEAPEAFLVDAVDVKIGVGDGARVRVLPWCDRPPQEIFPLRLSMHEQCNLLFAVELLSSPIDKEGFPSTQAATGELQRPVTITVRGQPISDVALNGDQSGAKVGTTEFQTRLFSSHWNCVLDLASPGPRVASQGESEALPEPPSPFPAATPRLAIPPTGQQGQQSPVLSPPSPHVLRSPRLSLSFRTSRTLVPSGSAPGSSPLSKHAYTPPSLTAAISSAPRTTYAPPASPGIPPPATLSRMLPMAETDEAFVGSGGTTPPPITPAYPAFSKGSTVLATSRAQGPLALWGSARASTAIELPRSGMLSLSSPVPSPLALLPSSSMVPQRERIVVSVGLQNDAGTGTGTGTRKLVPYDEFVLDIFIYNQSAWTRRFELTVQERRRKRHEKYSAGQGQRQQRYHDGAAVRGGSGVVPLENRVRVGPLRPATCQSVRIAFLALTPGVHTIDALTLTDTETRHALTLRTSMDIVVHETRPLNRPLPRC
ncbi:TRAPP trafficking subunit Trs65-domain-containing protein [Russula brevipes]|nr:TRAPP trafficking subunit Trs65-domain-containing protein [Russula brevipes]